MKSTKQILKEIQQLFEKSPKSVYSKVGNVIFGEYPDIVKLQKAPSKPREIDTNWESVLIWTIKQWVGTSETKTANFFAKNKELLKTLTKEFPAVLRPPIGKKVYRGTSIKTDSLRTAFLKKQYDVVMIGGKEVFHFKKLKYKPARKSQSWTVDPKVAFKFEGRRDNQKSVHVVYATTVNDDFIFSPQLMNIVFGQQESETIRIGGEGTFEAFVDSYVFKAAWHFIPKYNFIHKLSKAKPFFKAVVDKYNKAAARDNKDYPDETQIPLAKSIEDIIAYEEMDSMSVVNFNFNVEYGRAVTKFVKSVKAK
jgi:hypothetical protein